MNLEKENPLILKFKNHVWQKRRLLERFCLRPVIEENREGVSEKAKKERKSTRKTSQEKCSKMDFN